MLYVAEGRFGGCVNMFTCIWDIASLYLIIAEAGGLFKSLDLTDIEFMVDADHLHQNFPIVTGCPAFIDSIATMVTSHT